MGLETNLYYITTIILKLVLIAVICGLLKIYISSYRRIKIGFTAGLILFALIFLIKTIESLLMALGALFIPDYTVWFEFHNNILIESIIDLIAMSILYKVTRDE